MSLVQPTQESIRGSGAPASAQASAPSEGTRAQRAPWQGLDWLILLLLLLVGGALRFYQLGNIPPGFQFDEAFNALDAEQVLEGNFPLFLPANGGREVLFTYFQAGLIWFLGSSVWSFRLASALWGTAAVGAAFLLFRFVLRRDSRLIASLSAAALAISYWHIHFSHFGIRVITMPVLFSALFGCFFAATEAGTRTRRVLLYVLAGILLGASVWSNPTGRFAPFVLLLWVGVLLWRDARFRSLHPDGPVVGLVISGIAAFVVFLPLGITFLQNPDFFFGHASEVSVFAERVSGGQSPFAALLDNILHVLGMFTFYGDLEWTHGIPGRPVLDWIIGIPFYIGVVIWVMRLFGRNRTHDVDGNALWLLAIWVIVMLAPSVLSEAAPNYSRTLPSLPAVLLPIGLGLAWIVRLRWSRVWMGYALAGAILTASLVWTVYDYFVRFPQMEQAYYAWDVDKADALDILRERQEDAQVFLSPLWATHAPVRWLREGSGIKTLEPGQTLVLPADRGVVYAYTGEERHRAEALAAQIGTALGQEGAVALEGIRDQYGKSLLWLTTLSPEKVAQLSATQLATADARVPSASGNATHLSGLDIRFDDAPTLIGAAMDDTGTLLLEWRAEAPTLRDLTAFAHYIDGDGNRVAQVDRIPGDGSYPTYTWAAGDRVIDRLQPETFAPCTTGEKVRVATGWYEYAADGARRPRYGAPGDVAVVGDFTLPMRPLAQDEITPATWLDQELQIGPVTVLGYTLHAGGDMRPRQQATVDLYYRIDEATAPMPMTLRSADGEQVAEFATNSIPPVQGEASADVYCQPVRITVPTSSVGSDGAVSLASGAYPLSLWLGHEEATTASEVAIASSPIFTVTVDASPVSPQIPSEAKPINARFGESIVLDGARIGERVENALPVTLYWRTTENVPYPNVAFVQLLDSAMTFVSGSDVQPAPSTREWVPETTYTTEHLLTLTPDLPAGEYTLFAGMYDALSLERLAARSDAGVPYAQELSPIGSLRIGE